MRFAKLGRFVFAISMLAFGILACVHSSPIAGPALGPPWAPGNPLWTFFTDVALGVAGLSIVLEKKARLGATLLAVVIFLRVLLLYVPALISDLRNPGNWTSAFELLAMGSASLVLAGTLPVESSSFPRWDNLVEQAKKFGLPLVFREMHRVLQPGGLLLLAFHTGDEILQEKELWGRPISMDFFLFQPSAIRQYLEVAGLGIEEIIEREPYAPEVEYQSRRAYVFARKPGSLAQL